MEGPALRAEILRRHLLGYLPRRLREIASNVERWGDERLRPKRRAVAPLIVAGAAAACIGIWVEVLRPRRGKLGPLLGRFGSADGDRRDR